MALKPLKLRKFLSEEEAAQLLSQLIGEEVSSEEMAEYAMSGVVPAYIQFPLEGGYGKGFYLLSQRDALDDSITAGPHMADLHVGHLPYPFKEKWRSYFVNTNGNFIAAYVERSDGSLAKVADEHSYPRIYAPSEICQVAQILNDPLHCPEWPAVVHSHGPMWSDHGLLSSHGLRDDEEKKEGYTEEARLVSPYEWHKYLRGGVIPEPEEAGHGGRRINWQLIVAGMWEELRVDWKKQGALAEKIAERGWKGARKDDVNHALALAKKAKESLTP